MMYKYLFGALLALCFEPSHAQIDPILLKRIPIDTVRKTMSMDAVYNRPFVSAGKLPVALGGYLEANYQHLGTDGVSEGHQFQFRRLTLFVSSAIGPRLKFLSEIEFEDGGKEISVEFAALDIEFHPLLNLRGGVILNPIGSFNQNHDGPKWEFIDRPISATQLLPATWSNAGFGLYGKYYNDDWMFGYEAYASGSFDNSITDNKTNRTFLPAAKNNPERFEEINSGLPLLTAKIAVRNNKIGELGISYMGGVYNKFQDEGLILDKKRRVDVAAVDFNTSIAGSGTNIIGEYALVFVDVASSLPDVFGRRQQGGFIDIVQPIKSGRILGWQKSILNVAVRAEYVDWNRGVFRSTGENISDHLWSLMPALAFRPVPQTVIRLNYRHLRQTDFLGNPPAHTGGIGIGFSTYF